MLNQLDSLFFSFTIEVAPEKWWTYHRLVLKEAWWSGWWRLGRSIQFGSGGYSIEGKVRA
jgi:hypothetical protein